MERIIIEKNRIAQPTFIYLLQAIFEYLYNLFESISL
jgi:hypothetical protein